MLAICKLESLNATDHFRGLGVNGLVVLELDVRVSKWLIGHKTGLRVDACKYNNKTYSFTNCEFLD
jgi:hypothetical protein